MATAGTVEVRVDPDLRGFGSKLDAFTNAIKPFGYKVNLDSTLQRDLARQTSGAQRSLDGITTTRAQGELRQLGDTGDRELRRIGGGAKLSGQSLVAIGGGAAVAGTKIIQSLQPATDAASDLNETVSYSQVVFGDVADEIDRFGSSAAKNLGQSKRQAIDAATTFATFGKAAGLTGGDLVKFSTGLTKLATDLASAKNTSPAEAIAAIGSALRGESEPLRAYGVLLDDATLRQEALALGLIRTTKEALTPQQKVLAAQAAIYKQTTDAQGDYARTADSAANSAKRFAAEQENLRANRGQGLLGLLSAANEAGSALLNTIDRIPGATSVLGVGVFGIGAASILGGAATSIAGGVRVLREFRTGTKAAVQDVADLAANLDDAGRAASTTYSTGAIADGANVAAVATENVAAGFVHVTEASGAAGTAGAAAMGSVAAAAEVAALAVGTVGTALTAVGSVGTVAAVGSELAALGSGAQALESGVSRLSRGPFIDAEGWEVPVEPIRSLGSGISETADDAARAVGPLSNLGSTVKGVGSNVRGFIGGLPPLSTGLIATTIAVAGFGSAWSQLKEQTADGVRIFTEDMSDIEAAFDPEKPNRYGVEVEKLARILSGQDSVGEFNAWDKLNPIFDDAGNRAEVAAGQVKILNEAVTALPADKARQLVGDLAERLQSYGVTAADVGLDTEKLYAEIDKRESIDRARRAASGLETGITGVGNAYGDAAEKVDRFGFAIDETASRGARAATSLQNILDPVQAALDAQSDLEAAQRDVADAEAEVQRIRNRGVKGTKENAEAERDLADAITSVADARRSEASARRDLANEQRDLQALVEERAHVDPARDPNRARELDERIRDQRDTVLDAQDRMASAAEATQKAERDLGDTRTEQATKADDLAEAERNLAEKRDAEVRAAEGAYTANQALADLYRDHPEAITGTFKAIDEWVRKGVISTATADAWKRKVLELVGAVRTLGDVLAVPGGEALAGRGSGTVRDEGAAGATRAAAPPSARREAPANLPRKVGATVPEDSPGFPNLPLDNATAVVNGDVWVFVMRDHKWINQGRAAGRLAGGPLEPHQVYELTEDGNPEVATLGGRDFLFTGAQSGKVTPYPKLGGDVAPIRTQVTPDAVAAPGRVAVLERPTERAVDLAPVVERLQAVVGAVGDLRADITRLQNVTYAPTIHARPDQVERSMAEAMRAARADGWTNHGRWG